MPLLTDVFGRSHTYLRIAVTDRCNLRCGYCMPPDGITCRNRDEILTYEEITRVARVCVDAGVRKIRLTGGEPTVRHDLSTLVAQLAALSGLDTLALTTNGVLLREHAQRLKEAGLTAVNISLDTLHPERFRQITNSDCLGEVLAGIDTALAVGFSPVKLNVVVIAGTNDDELCDFIEFVRNRPINVRFIEYMPFQGNRWQQDGLLPSYVMQQRIGQRYPIDPLSGLQNGVARDYRLAGIAGTVSFISPLSQAFCADCSRLRLMADGSVKSCLFHPAEVNLRHALRSGATDAELLHIIGTALALKPAAHPPVDALAVQENRSMVQIGG
ncbi:MAG: GTP 3',8-cyclase MoaA [Armatimonadota bacterium]